MLPISYQRERTLKASSEIVHLRTHAESALIVVKDRILEAMSLNRLKIDWRSLERNKYAPWGRGSNAVAHGFSGAQV